MKSLARSSVLMHRGESIKFCRIALLLGMVVALAAGPAFAATKGAGGIRLRTAQGKLIPLYEDYQALVIGVSAYQHWPSLQGPVEDAEEVAAALRDMGFGVKLVLNPDSAKLKRELTSLPYTMGKKKDRALLVYFSGHGETEMLADGSKLGYVVPVDAPLVTEDPAGFASKAVSMKEFEALAMRIKSRHVLMVFDSCFSGSLFNMVKAAPSSYLRERAAEPVRQFITAGNEEEEVPDRSVFKTVFIQGLTKRYADRNRDGYVTGEELGDYLQEKVVNYTRRAQHPQFGKINNPLLDKGDFVFSPAGGAASQASTDMEHPTQLADSPGPALGEVDKRKLKIQRLLEQADADLAANRLTTPPGNNALEKYQEVLRLNPMTEAANEGLKRIVGKYVELAKVRLTASDFKRAEEFLDRASKASKGDKRVLAAWNDLREAKARAKVAAQEARKRAEAESRRLAEQQEKAKAARRERERQEAERKRQDQINYNSAPRSSQTQSTRRVVRTPCPVCGGIGNSKKCPSCNGSGRSAGRICPRCSGTGYIHEPCSNCGGTGYIEASY